MTRKNYQLEPQFERRIPDGDDHERSQCTSCGFVDYQNPKIVVGSVATWEDKYLLCRRAIEPRRGFWTLPAGFLELGETAEKGALREAWEEARAQLSINQLLAVYSVPHISQIQLMFCASLETPDISPGPESEDVMLVAWDDIPWGETAFPSVVWALRHQRQVVGKKHFPPFSNPTDNR